MDHTSPASGATRHDQSPLTWPAHYTPILLAAGALLLAIANHVSPPGLAYALGLVGVLLGGGALTWGVFYSFITALKHKRELRASGLLAPLAYGAASTLAVRHPTSTHVYAKLGAGIQTFGAVGILMTVCILLVLAVNSLPHESTRAKPRAPRK